MVAGNCEGPVAQVKVSLQAGAARSQEVVEVIRLNLIRILHFQISPMFHTRGSRN